MSLGEFEQCEVCEAVYCGVHETTVSWHGCPECDAVVPRGCMPRSEAIEANRGWTANRRRSVTEPYYEDDHVTIYHGDCLELIGDLDYDVVVTDPPYGIGWTKGENRKAKSRAHAGISNDEDTTTRDTALGMIGDKPAAVFGSFAAEFPQDVRQVLVWQKPNDAGVFGSVNGFRRDVEPVFVIGPWAARTARWSSVIRSVIPNVGSPSSPAGTTGHPHAKPIDLLRNLIEAIGVEGVILDPFMGSGSTLRAAKDLNRKAIGIEIDERYCEIAAKRCAQEVLPFGDAA